MLTLARSGRHLRRWLERDRVSGTDHLFIGSDNAVGTALNDALLQLENRGWPRFEFLSFLLVLSKRVTAKDGAGDQQY